MMTMIALMALIENQDNTSPTRRCNAVSHCKQLTHNTNLSNVLIAWLCCRYLITLSKA